MERRPDPSAGPALPSDDRAGAVFGWLQDHFGVGIAELVDAVPHDVSTLHFEHPQL
jgi:hypothetical protein